tara:strand:+ start:242 stop:454 length:213 start_codon:yes stop_codon:yes gene_type:complete
MKRFPKSKGKIQALNIAIMQFTCLEGNGYDYLHRYGMTDTFGEPLICTVEDIEWAMDYLWERCQKVEVTA